MKPAFTIRVAGPSDLPAIRQLALEIWPATYQTILSPEQIQYMLNLIYSAEALEDQLLWQQHRFVLAEVNAVPVGFADYSETGIPFTYKLHKIYVHPHMQGTGLGKALIGFVMDAIRPFQARSLLLNVNRYNKARFFYEKLGFTIIREEDIDIGNNFYMNDYVMEKKL